MLFLLLSLATMLFAQSSFKRNHLYLEAGGNGLFGSVNYERQLTRKPGIGLRLGVGVYSEYAFFLTIPAGIDYLFKLNDNGSFLDAGLGVTWARVDGNFFSESNNSDVQHITHFIPSIGYRKHTPRGVIWRLSLTPVANKNAFTPWAGISIGKRF